MLGGYKKDKYYQSSQSVWHVAQIIGVWKKKKKNEQDTSEGKFSGNTKEGEPVFIESKALA